MSTPQPSTNRARSATRIAIDITIGVAGNLLTPLAASFGAWFLTSSLLWTAVVLIMILVGTTILFASLLHKRTIGLWAFSSAVSLAFAVAIVSFVIVSTQFFSPASIRLPRSSIDALVECSATSKRPARAVRSAMFSLTHDIGRRPVWANQARACIMFPSGDRFIFKEGDAGELFANWPPEITLRTLPIRDQVGRPASVNGKAFLDRTPTYVPDTSTCEFFHDCEDTSDVICGKAGSIYSIPIFATDDHKGDPIAMFSVCAPISHYFSPNDLLICDAYAKAISVQLRRMEQ